MFRFIETIKIVDGIPQNLEYHRLRMANTLSHFYSRNNLPDIENIIAVPTLFKSGLVKCRVEYSDVDYKAQYDFYTLRNIQTLKLVKCDTIDYEFKFSDRRTLKELLLDKGDCDDILIVKNEMITDTSYTNIAFSDRNKWYTPITPLLNGTARMRLIETGQIFEREITIHNFREFDSFILINCMLENKFSNARSTNAIVS